MLRRGIGLLAVLAALTSPVHAQVRQSGIVNAGHATSWTTTGVIQDAGSAASGSITTLGVTNTGTPICINDGPITGSYHQLCLGANSLGGGLLSYNAYGGASNLPLQINVNGTTSAIGTGTINTGTLGQLLTYLGTGTIVGPTTYASLTNGALTLGTPGTQAGSVILGGSATGTVTLGADANAGGYTFRFPTSQGTTGQVLSSAGPGATPTWQTVGGTVVSSSAGQYAYYPSSSNSVQGSSLLSQTGSVVTDVGGLSVTPANQNVVLSPTGTGVVTINPGTLGTMDNVTVGGTTKAAGSFTTISANTTASIGSAGSSLGQILLSGNGSGTITMQPQAAAGTYNWNLPITAGSANQILLSGGGGASPMTWGSRSGNTTTFATTSGSLTNTHAAVFDASGNIVDGGALPTGTITSAANTNVAVYSASTTVGGSSNLTYSAGAFTIGSTGTQAGSLLLSGSSTGTITVKGSGTTIGTYNFNLPTTSGTSGQILASGGGSAAAMSWDSVSGTTTTLATVTGGLTNGHCLAADASGNLIDNGSPCGSGGSGTVTSGTATQLAYYPSSTNSVASNSNLTIVTGAGVSTLTVGSSGSNSGVIAIPGSGTGTITLKPQTAAGTWEWDWPTAAGTAGQVLTSQGGAGSAMTWTSAGVVWKGVQNTSFSAVSNSAYCVDTTGGAVTMTLPGSPADGDQVRFIDCVSNFGITALTVGRNSKKIMGLTQDMTVGVTNAAATLVYVSANGDWRMY